MNPCGDDLILLVAACRQTAAFFFLRQLAALCRDAATFSAKHGLALLAAFSLWPGLPANAAETVSTNQLRPWADYRTVMWVGDTVWKKPGQLPLFLQRLREMGINTAMVSGDADPQPFLTNGFPYYVENVVNRGLCLKWNSQVRDWDKFVTTWAKQGRPESAFVREFCLDDPQWRGWARSQMQRVARRNREHAPLAYDIRDELSVTISANPFDYDFSPLALTGFRDWLKIQYADLNALNRQWQTQFISWDEVKPFSTDQIKNRMASGDAMPRGQPDWQAVQRIKFDPAEARQQPTRWNFSPWCDFRTYMDLSLARALDDCRQAARDIDPRTPVGIEGTQMPSAFGGYDLWRLGNVLDWVEPYDIGNAREIFGSFMPGKPVVTTVFEKDTPHALRRLWHLLLEGDRGCIIWWSEDCVDWQSQDYALTAKAKALAPVLREMASPLARLFLTAEKESDPIAVHYSQPSIQVDWLLESTVDGSTWLRRFSSFEADHNRMARVRHAWVKAVQDLGYSPVFVSSEQIERGELDSRGFRALVLPESLALSDREGERIRAFFFGRGGQPGERVIFCDGTPGLFDEHGRLRSRSRLEDLIPLSTSEQASHAYGLGRKASRREGDVSRYAKQRAEAQPDLAVAKWIGEALSAMPAPVRVPLETRTRVHRFKLGDARLLAFERNISYHMSEDLKQGGGNEALEKPVAVEATLAAPAHVYDLRTRQYLGRTDRLRFNLDPWQPSLFALLAEEAPAEKLLESLQQKAGGSPR